MKTKESKSILVYENEIQIKKDLNALDMRILPHCPAVQKAFENLNLGDMTENYLHDILYNSCREIERELIAKSRLETNELLLNEALKQVAARIQTVIKAQTILLERSYPNGNEGLLHYLSVSENGNIIFSAQSKEELKETYREYVTTEAGITRRQLHEKAAKALNDFRIAMNNEDILEYFDISNDDEIMLVPVSYE